MRTFVGAVLVMALAGFAIAGQDKDKDKVDIKKLMGKWEPKDEKGVTVEFADKGKVILSIEAGGKSEKIEGSYKVDGNKIDVAISIGGKEEKETLTVKKLTDEELVTVTSKGKEETMKRKK